MALLTRDDLKNEMDLRDGSDNDLLDNIALFVCAMWDSLTNMSWEFQAHTEFHNAPARTRKVFLENYPVSQTATITVHDDPDWEWGSAALIASTEYRIDYERGIVHYNSYFFEGDQSIKVVYSAGYTATTLPKDIKGAMRQQGAVWFKMAKKGTWDVKSMTIPAGGGGVVLEQKVQGLLPTFKMLAQMNAR